eukprot:CAMPEP_0178435906 /NCGR_PEP_ID=MMETSP0689_2-20121128/34168_1 /TAXON_ID=160604 /ORGANISM="Amphidinium massartii, Strain CS-259" /LENGTH=359 /DNA_ID=CAMNT_0020057991 /DNA_START=68 /DNA_END=1147 /DNA_ORIENTATION=-
MKWELRRPVLQRWLRTLAKNHDILCFQEAERGSMLSDLHEVLAPLGFDAVELTRSTTLVNATFFRSEVFALNWVDRRSRVLLVGLALKDGQEVSVVNVHLEASDHESQRIAQLKSALRRAALHKASCTIVCGDFNSPLACDSHLRALLSEQGLLQVKTKGEVTYSVAGFSAVLDHIWADAVIEAGEVLRASIGRRKKNLELPDDRHPSDHLPVRASIVVPDGIGRLLEALSRPLASESARAPNAEIMQEWLETLQGAHGAGAGKKAAKEQRHRERSFLEMVEPEEAAYLEGYKLWTSSVAQIVVANASAKARANIRSSALLSAPAEQSDSTASTEASCDGCVWDPGGQHLQVHTKLLGG